VGYRAIAVFASVEELTRVFARRPTVRRVFNEPHAHRSPRPGRAGMGDHRQSARASRWSVAVSMKEAPRRSGVSSRKPIPDVTLRYNVGASGDLQKQIEAGAPVDVFVSAATRQMDELEAKSLIVSATRRAFARKRPRRHRARRLRTSTSRVLARSPTPR
jgi:hypothetical protein